MFKTRNEKNAQIEMSAFYGKQEANNQKFSKR